MQVRELLSVGIDVGTTTTQVIFSRLALVNRAAVSQVPRYEFVDRKMIWQSPILLTPVDKGGYLREEELLGQILDQYAAAGMDRAAIDSGAIIITGETAKTRNAYPAVVALSQKLGSFVVATAGPHLESVIAGFGSGAQRLSEQKMARVLNIDIGGGTANYALFGAGHVISSACLNVGGRLFETDSQGRVTYVHPPGCLIVRDCFGEWTDPLSLTPTQLNSVAERMSMLLYEVISSELSPLAGELLMTDSLPDCQPLYAVTLSGGVGECYRSPETGNDFRFGDIGPLLARAMRRDTRFNALPMQTPAQTVRATVIGAGAHTLSLSGSTIWLDSITLPVRNIPVVHPGPGCIGGEDLMGSWCRALTRMDLNPQQDRYALALPDSLPTRYASVQIGIDALQRFIQTWPSAMPLLVIARQDFGKALGMLLHPLMKHRELAVIDQVFTRAGDYIDIGTPLFSGAVVPVTVKSLAFPS